MNLSDIITKCYILALFIRDDGERLLLGDGFFEFKESLQHFQPNTFVNDVVELQGTDGQLLAGQVRRTAVQTFEGFIGDGTIGREQTETNRRRFLQFFRKKHFYTVVYILPDGSAVQRDRGYIVNAPSVPELYQRFPEYSVGLNFEDPNYYEYDEGEDGDEIPAHSVVLSIANLLEGGLIWDAFGAVSNEKTWLDWENGTTTDGFYTYSNGLAGAPLEFTQLDGNATQQTYSGKNIYDYSAKPVTGGGITWTLSSDGTFSISGTLTTSYQKIQDTSNLTSILEDGQTYTLSLTTSTTDRAYAYPMLTRHNISAGTNEYLDAKLGTPVTFVVDKTHYTYSFNVQTVTTTAWGASSRSFTLKVQLEKGNQATEFQKYVGGIPAPNPDFPQEIKTVTGAQTVEITGKNLFDCMTPYRTGGTFYNLSVGTQIVSEQSSSVTITQTSNGCKIAVPSWGGAVFVFPLRVGTTYHLKYTLTSSSNRMSRYTLDADHKVVRQLGNLTTNPISEDLNVSLQNGEAYYAIAFGSNSAITLTLTEPQLELGNTATTYAPYQAQSQEIAIDKNLAILPLFQMGGMTNGVLTTSNFRTTNANNPVTVKPNTKYTASVELHNAVLGFRVGIHECAADGTFIRDLGWKQIGTDPFTMTTGSDCYKVKFVCTLSTTSTVVTTGSTEDTTAFTSADKWFRGCIFRYNEGETVAPTIELAGVGQIQSDGLPKYHDSFKRVDGVWYIHKETGKLVLNGSENWASYTQQVTGFYNGFATSKKWGFLGGSFQPTEDFMNDHFQNDGTYFYQDSHPECIASTEYACYCHIKSTTAADAAALKTWLSTHNTTVYYRLATATDTQITDTDLLAQLNAIASTFDGVNNITITPSAGAQGELSVHYATGSIDVGAGYEWEEGSDTGTNVVINNGIDSVNPTWIVSGPATNPTLTNITTGQTIVWEGSVASGQTLTVDLNRQTAELGGTNVFAQLSGDWVKLAPGPNKLAYSATGATEGCRLEWNGVVG